MDWMFVSAEGINEEKDYWLYCATLIYKEWKSGNKVNEEFVKEIDYNLRLCLSDIDKFWIRWSFMCDILSDNKVCME